MHRVLRSCKASAFAMQGLRSQARSFSEFATPRVFDKPHRKYAASLPDSKEYDYLRDAVAAQVVERLDDITREFPVAVDLGANTGNVVKALEGRGGIRKLYMVEECKEMLYRDHTEWSARKDIECVPVESSLETRLPFDDASVDLVLSSASMHWVNDIQSLFHEVKRILKPDGVLLGGLIGGDTLRELRTAFVTAELDRDGGVSPHTSPYLTVPDVGNMLAGTGFGLPTVDSDTITIEYPNAASVFEHLQKMGENSASLQARLGAHPSTFLAATAAYQGAFGNADDSVPATFQIIHFIGWAPAASQPKPLRRGSVSKGFGARGGGPPPSL